MELGGTYGKWLNNKEISMSYLPLSHVAAQMFDCYMMMVTGGMVAFADKNALKGTLASGTSQLVMYLTTQYVFNLFIFY